MSETGILTLVQLPVAGDTRNQDVLRYSAGSCIHESRDSDEPADTIVFVCSAAGFEDIFVYSQVLSLYQISFR